MRPCTSSKTAETPLCASMNHVLFSYCQVEVNLLSASLKGGKSLTSISGSERSTIQETPCTPNSPTTAPGKRKCNHDVRGS